jgi:hypothetical protein
MLLLVCHLVLVFSAEQPPPDLHPITLENDTITERDVDHDHALLRIIRCEFYFCGDSQDPEHQGGALEVAYSQVTITDSDFSTCLADLGGACCFRHSTVSIHDTNFSTNLADDSGAACFDNCEVTINGGAAEFNEALEIGCYSFTTCTGSITKHVLFHNVAHQGETGGICLDFSPITFSACSFLHNHVEDGWAGAFSIYHISGPIRFSHCIFVSNEVVEWRDTHMFVSGTNTTLELSNCQFDNPDENEAILLMVENGKVPTVHKDGVRFGARLDHPYLHLMQNDSIEYQYVFKHASSDRFAMVVFVAVPLFILCSWLLLTAKG